MPQAPRFDVIDEFATARAIVQLIRNIRAYAAAVPEAHRLDYGVVRGVRTNDVAVEDGMLVVVPTYAEYTEAELLALTRAELLHVEVSGFRFLSGGYEYTLDRYAGWMRFRYDSPVGDRMIGCGRLDRCGGRLVVNSAWEDAPRWDPEGHVPYV